MNCLALIVFENLLIIIPTWGLGFVQERTLTSIPPPQDALQGVATVDQGLEIFWNKFQIFENIFVIKMALHCIPATDQTCEEW